MCHVLHFIEWPKITDNINHTYQMKMMMIILLALNRQESLDKFSHTYTRYKITILLYYKLQVNYDNYVYAAHKYTMYGREHASIHIQGSHMCIHNWAKSKKQTVWAKSQYVCRQIEIHFIADNYICSLPPLANVEWSAFL